MDLGSSVFYIGSVLALFIAIIAIFIVVFTHFKKKLFVPRRIMIIIPLILCVVLVFLAIISFRGFPWLTVVGTISFTALATLLLFLWLALILEPIAKKMGYQNPKRKEENKARL